MLIPQGENIPAAIDKIVSHLLSRRASDEELDTSLMCVNTKLQPAAG